MSTQLEHSYSFFVDAVVIVVASFLIVARVCEIYCVSLFGHVTPASTTATTTPVTTTTTAA